MGVDSHLRSVGRWLLAALAIVIIAIAPLSASAQISPLDEAPPSTETPFPALSLDDPAVQAQITQYINQYIDDLTAAILENMTVEDRVGQLFVVNFQGDDVGYESDISTLIHEYRVGGVVLSPEYGNFFNQKNLDAPTQVAILSNRLQALAYGRLLPPQIALDMGKGGDRNVAQLPLLVGAGSGADREPVNLPLFIGMEQLGDELSTTSLRNHFTELPNQLTLGSTWNLSLSQGVGEIVGRELGAVGVNLLLGPILDVYANPRTDSVGSLGVQSYGGNPFWVSQMGRSYITGVHEGSGGRMATVARHFPGQGDADRLPTEEVATIQSSADALRDVAIPPFTAVTQPSNGDAARVRPLANTDAFMSSHMRYSAFQALGGERVPPLGFSPDLSTVLEEEGFSEWRARGGLLMSNALGLPAIRRDYDATLSEFPFRLAALDAFTAGNDLIYLGDLSTDGSWENEFANIQEIIRFFQTRYTSDLDFAVQVDVATQRILRAKLLLYLDEEALTRQALDAIAAGEFDDGEVTIDPSVIDVSLPAIPLEDLFVSKKGLEIFTDDNQSRIDANALVREAAGESLTILAPDPEVVTDALPAAPQADEQIVIFTDSRLFKECETCVAEAPIAPEEIADIIVRLYGPDATDQITPDQLTSLTFSDLTEILDAQRKVEAQATAEAQAVSASPSEGAEISATETLTAPVTLDLQLPQEDKISKIEREIDGAEWIVFAMLNVDPERYPNSDVVKRFLRERSTQIAGKNVIVLALQAPYFLDATEIGQLTTYLGVYSKSTPFLENAVRALFRNFTPTGAPAVRVEGTRFSDLSERLSPDPEMQIPLSVTLDDMELANGAEQSSVNAGDTVFIQVGPVLDHNGNPVPDGTLVDFRLIYEGAELALPIEPSPSHAGIATRAVLLERGGVLRISASSGEASTGEPILLTVFDVDAAGGQAQPSASADAAGGGVAPSTAVQPAADANGEAATSSDAGADATASDQALLAPTERVNLVTLGVALFVMIVMLSLLLIVQIGTMPRATLVYNMLWAVIAGLTAYILYGLGALPGSQWLRDQLGIAAAVVVVFVGMILPLLWLQLRIDLHNRRSSQ
jgi:beta-N-acetylhexosaminidase